MVTSLSNLPCATRTLINPQELLTIHTVLHELDGAFQTFQPGLSTAKLAISKTRNDPGNVPKQQTYLNL